MNLRFIPRIFSVLMVLGLLGGVFLIADTPGHAQTYSFSTNRQIVPAKTNPVTSFSSEWTVVDFPRPFSGIALHVLSNADDDFSWDAAVQIFRDGQWSNTLPLSDMAEEGKAYFDSGHLFSAPLIIRGEKIRYHFSSSDAQEKNLEWIALISEKPSLAARIQSIAQHIHFSTATAQDTLPIISRSQWGADEKNRTWKPQYTDVQHIVVHHTAGGDGGTDPALTIQAIYFYHAQVLGWGDIGYNFLVDPAGNIYEGRFGGDGVIGAHAYNDRTRTNYNEHSLGISVLGCYDAFAENGGGGGCSSPNSFTQASEDVIVNLSAEKSKLWKLDPSHDSLFINKTTPVVITHRDVDATACPGSIIYATMERIRIRVVERLALLGDIRLPYRATSVDQTLRPATFVKDAYSAIIRFQNTGSEKWTPNNIKLLTYDLDDRPSVYTASGWPSRWGEFSFQESEVAPDGIATFTVPLLSPARPGLYKQIYRLKHQGDVITGSEFSVTTGVHSHYQAELVDHNIPLAVLDIWRPTTTIRMKNVGVGTWSKNMVLNVYDLGYRESRFRDRSWTESTGKVLLQEPSVSPGHIGTFRFMLDAPIIGNYRNIFRMEIPGRSDIIVENGEFSVVTRVDPSNLTGR